MNRKLLGVALVAAGVLAASAARANEKRNPERASTRTSDDRRLRANGGVDAINSALRPQREQDFQRRTLAPDVNQLTGTVVRVRSKVLYLRIPEGAIVPVDAKDLVFRKTVQAGEEVRATFQVQDGVTNKATQLDIVRPEEEEAKAR